MKKIFFLIFALILISSSVYSFQGATTNYNISTKIGLIGANSSLTNLDARITGDFFSTLSSTNSYNQRTGVIDYTYNDIIAPIINSTKINLTITKSTDGSITLTWSNDTNSDISKYNIYRKNSTIMAPVNSSQLISSNISALTWIDTSTKLSNTTYYYVLTAIDNSNNENLSAITNAVNITTSLECSNDYSSWSDWSTCSGGSQSRERSRTCYLVAGNIQTNTSTKECVSPSASSSSGSSGSAETLIEKISITLSEIIKNTSSIITIDNKNISIYEANINVNETLSNIKFTFSKIDTKPEGTEAPKENEKVFKYIEVKLSSNKDKIKQSNLKFKVEKTWLTNNNLDKNFVRLYRQTTQWDELDTKIISEDATYIYYESITPGFSYFKISVISKPQTITGNTVKETTPITPSNTNSNTQNNNPSSDTIPNNNPTDILNIENLKDTKSSKTNYLYFFLPIFLIVLITSFFIVTKYNSKEKILPVKSTLETKATPTTSDIQITTISQTNLENQSLINKQEELLEQYLKTIPDNANLDIIKQKLIEKGWNQLAIDKAIEERLQEFNSNALNPEHKLIENEISNIDVKKEQLTESKQNMISEPQKITSDRFDDNHNKLEIDELSSENDNIDDIKVRLSLLDKQLETDFKDLRKKHIKK